MVSTHIEHGRAVAARARDDVGAGDGARTLAGRESEARPASRGREAGAGAADVPGPRADQAAGVGAAGVGAGVGLEEALAG